MVMTIHSNVEQQENIDEEPGLSWSVWMKADLLVLVGEALLDLDCVMNG